MKGFRWFVFFLGRSVSQRWMRMVIAALSVTLAVSVIVGMAGLSLGIREKLGDALKAYGANIIVSSVDGRNMPAEAWSAVRSLPSVASVLPQLYGQIRIQDVPVELIGTDMDTVRSQGWRMKGEWPSSPGQVAVGSSLGEVLGVGAGDPLELMGSTGVETFTVTGFFERGSDADRGLMVGLKDAGRLLAMPDQLSALLVRSRGEIAEAVPEISRSYAGISVKGLRQIAQAETSLLAKIQLLMALVTVVVVGACVISVGSTMGATVLERREEIGLMKAIGGTRRSVSLFYLSEAGTIGLLGGLLGWPLGFISAQAVSRGAFGSYISVPHILGVAGLVLGLVIAVLAGHFPVRDAMKPRAAEILRGE